MTINKKVRNWAHVKSDMIERRDPLCRLFTKLQMYRLSRFFRFVAVRSFTVDSCLLQPTGGVNTTPHTSIFHSESHAHAWLKFGSALIPSHLMFHVSSGVSVWSLRRLHFPLSAHHLSYHPVLPSARQLHLPGGGGQIPCALPPMRTLNAWRSRLRDARKLPKEECWRNK